jgi:ubiquitin-protein ligase
MSSPRLRRLHLDSERLESRFRDWPAIRITSATGEPPEQYQVTYNTRGLYSTPAGQILERGQHVVEINLSLGYPRRAPQCKILTPIFHPNFDEVSVCIGDFWAASEGLDDLIVRIGRMIAYQEYNTKSPLNGLAAKWAAQNAHLLPVDSKEIAPPSDDSGPEDGERLVVQIDGELSSPEIDPEAALSEAVADEFARIVPAGVPRLDFGTIAVALRPGRTSVGRAPDNSIQLSHISVSCYHAELIETDAEFSVRDLGSTNGTTLNGFPINEAILTSGDRIHFGEFEAVFVID